MRGHTGNGVAVRPRLTFVCFIMADNPISSFPIARLLLALGARPGHFKNTFHSPFREDKDASLHIDPGRNVWFDHGAAIGGGNIDLVMRCRNCTAREAAQYILSLLESGGERSSFPCTEQYLQSNKPDDPNVLVKRIIKIRELQSPYLLNYTASRGIPEVVAKRYCSEVVIRGKTFGKSYDTIGFRNNNDGFALKSPSGFKITTKAGITTIDRQGNFSDKAKSSTLSVFEGVFDFLSWLASKDLLIPSTDVVVLNSVSNIAKAIPYLRMHDTIICYLDHDQAGRAALENIKSLRRDLWNPTIIDGSLFYFGYKDVNEWWTASKTNRKDKP